MKDKANYMSQEKFNEVIENIPELKIRKWHDKDIEMLFKILYWCGLRPIEGIMLKKEDFDLEEREVDLGKTKTKKNDAAVIPRDFILELEEYLDTKREGRLLSDLTYNTFYPWLKKLGKICQVPAWTTPESKTGEKTVGHIFRKSVGKDMFGGMYGKDAKRLDVISKHMRHKKPSITFDHYLKVDIEAVKEVW